MKIVQTAFAVLAMLFGLTGATLANDLNVSTGLTIKGSPLAVHGYDVVAYRTVGQPTRGKATYSAEYKGATYRFASRKNLRAFRREPARYLPQYGGFCAYGVAVGGKLDGDPTLWRIVDGKLYLNLNPEIQRTWEGNIPRYIRRADRNWTRIAGKAPDELS